VADCRTCEYFKRFKGSDFYVCNLADANGQIREVVAEVIEAHSSPVWCEKPKNETISLAPGEIKLWSDVYAATRSSYDADRAVLCLRERLTSGVGEGPYRGG